MAGSGWASMRSGQSSAVMSQKRHSDALAVVGGGSGAATALDEGYQAAHEALVKAAAADEVGAGGVEDLGADPGVAVLLQGPGQGVHVDHELAGVGRAFLAGLDVDDEDVVAVDDEEIGSAG